MSFRPAVENARPGSRDLSLRWVAVTIFILSSTLNYLDRNLIAVLAPLILAEFQLKQTGFGLLISAFSFAYAGSSLLVGWFLDRVGINRGISAAVGWWSAAAVGSGLVRTLPGLTFCRVALGMGEAAGVPAVGKLNGLYLKAEERAMGASAEPGGPQPRCDPGAALDRRRLSVFMAGSVCRCGVARFLMDTALALGESPHPAGVWLRWRNDREIDRT